MSDIESDVEDDYESKLPAVQLGFLVEHPKEPLPKHSTHIPDFPNKIGGLPLYTPEDAIANAFHRVVYLFCCKNGPCHSQSQSQCFKVFRTQFPEENPVYNVDGELLKETSKEQYCCLCGLKGSLRCSGCKSRRYCSKEHATLDWNLGNHKTLCSATSQQSAIDPASSDLSRTAATFPEFELESEDEPKETVAALPDAGKIEATINTLGLEDPTEEEVLEDDTTVDVDDAFLKFQRRIARMPEQVIRYARVANDADRRGLEPLLVSDLVFAPEGVPACPYCHAERSFEFQVMPQLLSSLGLNASDRDSLDWGTVLVFTCSADCQPSGVQYMEDAVFAQGYSMASLGDTARAARKRAMERAAAGRPIDEEEEGDAGQDDAQEESK
eukprot:jgi/Hompol1/1159/HPOL_004473-RA